jgi:hypothetical protein
LGDGKEKAGEVTETSRLVAQQAAFGVKEAAADAEQALKAAAEAATQRIGEVLRGKPK